MPDDSFREDATGPDGEGDDGRDPGTVLITGCSSGIGRATALTFLEDDWTVYATARDTDDLADLAEVGCATAELDVTEHADVQRVVDRIMEEDGRIDALVNNAGHGQFGPLEEVPTEAVAEQFDVNVYGPHRLIREVLPYMRRQEHGAIVNVSSVWGRISVAGGGAYAGSKHALEAFSDALRQEVSAFDVNVSVVEPGPVDTGFTERAEDELDALQPTGAYPWFESAFEDVNAIGGGGPAAVSPKEVASAIHHAASCEDPEPRYPVGVPGSVATMGRFLPDRWRDRVFSLVRRVLS
jgi:NAD(P)-dependent dehydrogenase (short-subunit alcohol dehydrogenase family)